MFFQFSITIKVLQYIDFQSPTSLKVTHRQLKKGAHMDLKECLEMEYRISQRIAGGHDFAEGVRASKLVVLVVVSGTVSLVLIYFVHISKLIWYLHMYVL